MLGRGRDSGLSTAITCGKKIKRVREPVLPNAKKAISGMCAVAAGS